MRERLPFKLTKCWKTGKTTLDKRGAETLRNKARRERNKELVIYECRHCFHWHLSSNIELHEERTGEIQYGSSRMSKMRLQEE